MIRLLVALALALSTSSAIAGQQAVQQTIQVPPMTTQQVVLNCALSGAILSGLAAVGVLKPYTLAVSASSFALFHEAVYGCGIGVISGLLGQSLVSMIPMPPQPSPFGGQNSAMLPDSSMKR